MTRIKLLRVGSAKRLTRSVIVGKYHEPLNMVLYLPEA